MTYKNVVRNANRFYSSVVLILHTRNHMQGLHQDVLTIRYRQHHSSCFALY